MAPVAHAASSAEIGKTEALGFKPSVDAAGLLAEARKLMATQPSGISGWSDASKAARATFDVAHDRLATSLETLNREIAQASSALLPREREELTNARAGSAESTNPNVKAILEAATAAEQIASTLGVKSNLGAVLMARKLGPQLVTKLVGGPAAAASTPVAPKKDENEKPPVFRVPHNSWARNLGEIIRTWLTDKK